MGFYQPKSLNLLDRMLIANSMGTVDMSYFNNPPIHLTDDERVLKSLKSKVKSSQEGSERK